MIRRWRSICVVALALVSSGCAVPCVDDGFLGMQHAAACVADTSSTGSTGSTGQTSTGDCSCTTDAGVCGDGVVDMGELCDDADADEVDACNSACKPTPTAIELVDGDDTAIEGGPGGAPFDDACAPGDLLVGFAGDLDAQGRIGRLHGLCAPLLLGDDGAAFLVTTGAPTDLPTQGLNDTGGAWTAVCPGSTVVVGFSGRESATIDQLVVRCATLDVAVSAEGDYSLVFGAPGELPAAGVNVDGAPFTAQDCPPGQVAVRQLGFSGQTLDGFGLGCASLTLLL